MATDQLSLYNEALRLIGERSLADLDEDREPRYLLDDVWNAGAVNYCLEKGQWKFATRAVQLDYNPAIEPPFGYTYGFTLPDDRLRSISVCLDQYFNLPLLQYSEEAGFIYSPYQTIFYRYISNDADFGNNLALWPETFKRFVVAYLATEICEKITQNANKYGDLYKIMEKRLTDALSKDAMNDPTKFPPMGSWANARFGAWGVRFPRGESGGY